MLVYTMLLKSIFSPPPDIYLLSVCHTDMFQVFKDILILEKHNQRKCKTYFLNSNFINQEKPSNVIFYAFMHLNQI